MPINDLPPPMFGMKKNTKGSIDDLPPPNRAESDLGFLASAARAIDSYTGAPVRKAIGTLQEGKGISSALSQGMSQFGENPDLAPSGKEIALKAGFKDEPLNKGRVSFGIAKAGLPMDDAYPMNQPSAADVVGLGVEMGADITNVLPVGKIVQGAGKIASGGAKAISNFAKPISKVESGIANVAKKGVLTGLFGVPEESIKYYLANHPYLKDKVGAREMMEETAGKLYAGIKPTIDKLNNLENQIKVAKENRAENLGELLLNKQQLQQNLKDAQQRALGETGAIVANRVKELDKRVRAGSERSYQILDEEGVRAAITPIKSDLTKGINLLEQEAITDTQVAVVDLLKRYRDRFDKLGKDISGGQAKRLIQSLDSEINSLAPGEIGRLSKPDQVLGILRRRIDEQIKKSPAYEAQMKVVADDTRLLKQVESMASESDAVRALQAAQRASGKDKLLMLQAIENKFGDKLLSAVETSSLPEYQKLKGLIRQYNELKKGEGIKRLEGALLQQQAKFGEAADFGKQGIEGVEKGLSSYIRASNPNPVQGRQIRKAGDLAGIKMDKELEDIRTIASFEKGYNRGSANTNFWNTVVGGVVGGIFGPVGTAAGAIGGGFFGKALVDNFGPAIGRKILDQVPNLQKMKPSEWIAKLDVPKSVKMKLEDQLALYELQNKVKVGNLLLKTANKKQNIEKE